MVMKKTAAESLADANAGLSRRARNKLLTRAAILNAAKKCFGKNGISGTTMDQIAHQADIARATLFNYFPSKGDIVAALVEDLDEAFYADINYLRRKPMSLRSRIEALFRRTGHAVEGSAPYIRTIVGASELGWNENTGFSRFRRMTSVLQEMLEDGLSTGELREDIDIHILAEVVTSSLVGIIHNWRMDESYPVSKHMAETGRFLASMVVKPF